MRYDVAGPLQGCLVQWNPIERTFDCPCHGSAFSREGICIQVSLAAYPLALPMADNLLG